MENFDSKKYFWILLNVLVAGIIVNLVFFVMPTIRQYGNSLSPSRAITVSAEGKTIASPDIAETSFSVVSQGKNPDELSSENNMKMSAVIQNLKSQGIDEKDIKTSGYNLSPDYQYDESTKRSYISGYTLKQTVLVKIRDLAKAAKVVGGVTPLGVNQIGGISFTVDDPEKFFSQARTDAFAKAQKKAKEMAAQNGARLGKVLSISEYQNAPIPYMMNERAFAGAGMSAPAALPTIEPGTQDVKVQVSVTYALE